VITTSLAFWMPGFISLEKAKQETSA